MKERHITAIQRHKRPIYAINKETGIQGYQHDELLAQKQAERIHSLKQKKTNPLHELVNYMNQNQEIYKKKNRF
jgi:hypothetical protein